MSKDELARLGGILSGSVLTRIFCTSRDLQDHGGGGGGGGGMKSWNYILEGGRRRTRKGFGGGTKKKKDRKDRGFVVDSPYPPHLFGSGGDWLVLV